MRCVSWRQFFPSPTLLFPLRFAISSVARDTGIPCRRRLGWVPTWFYCCLFLILCFWFKLRSRRGGNEGSGQGNEADSRITRPIICEALQGAEETLTTGQTIHPSFKRWQGRYDRGMVGWGDRVRRGRRRWRAWWRHFTRERGCSSWKMNLKMTSFMQPELQCWSSEEKGGKGYRQSLMWHLWIFWLLIVYICSRLLCNEDNEENREKRKAFMAEWNITNIETVLELLISRYTVGRLPKDGRRLWRGLFEAKRNLGTGEATRIPWWADSGAPPVCQGFHLETYSPRPYRDFKEVNRAITFKQFLHGNLTTSLTSRISGRWWIRSITQKTLLALNDFITPAGMKLLVKQLYLARDVTVDGPCSGSFTTIYNIPCYHDIHLLKQFSAWGVNS